jgi:hypothetical protein
VAEVIHDVPVVARMPQSQRVPELVHAGEVDDALAEERVASGAFGNVGAKRPHVGADVESGAEPPVDDDGVHLAVLTLGRFSPIETHERR